MEQRDFPQNPIRHLGLHSVDGPDQLSRGFEAAPPQSHHPAKSRIVFELGKKDETAAVFLGTAGAVVSARVRRLARDAARGDYEIAQDTMGCKQVDGCARTVPITTYNPKWGGLTGCAFADAHALPSTAKDAHLATVYRPRYRIAAHCGRVFAIQ